MAESLFENQYKVKLVSMVDSSERVAFDVTPSLSINAPVEYSSVMPIHMPGAQQVYRNTMPRTFTIVATLISRTVDEATANQNKVHQLSSWRYPYFGINSASVYQQPSNDSGAANQSNVDMRARTNQPSNNNANQQPGTTDQALARVRNNGASSAQSNVPQLLGAPPPILYLYAYSSTSSDNRQTPAKNLNRIPVVLASLDYSYPDNVDYLPTNNSGEPWPARMELSMSLIETHSPREFEQFSLTQFKAGLLRNF